MSRHPLFIVAAHLYAGLVALQAAPDRRFTLPIRFEFSHDGFRTRVGASILRLRPAATELCTAGGVVRTTLIGADPNAREEGLNPLEGSTNYFLGTRHETQRNFRGVRYAEVWPGISLVYHGEQGAVEYDFIVAPGARPDAIRMRVDGARKVALDRQGDLVIVTADGELRWRRPDVYQDDGTRQRSVAGRFRLLDANTVAFAAGPYDRTRALVIDPKLDYSSYFGGSGNEWARAAATDASGNLYVTGATTSPNLPVTAGAPQSAYKGQTSSIATGDVFVAKFTAAGTLVYLTYLGGAADDIGMGIAVDSAGNAFVTGMTNSADFPVTQGALQTTYGGGGRNQLSKQGDAFVVKLNPAGNQLVYSTFLGGSQDDTGMAITVDSTGNAFVTGTTLSADFRTSASAFQSNNRGAGGQGIFPRFGTAMFTGGDAFVTKLNPAGSQILFSTFLGGGGDDVASSIAIDGSGNVYVGGYTLSTNFPVTASAPLRSFRGVDENNEFFNFGDGFLAKLNATGTALLYATYLGGRGDDSVTSIAVDATGNLFATGVTSSPDFPTTAGAFQTNFRGPTSIPLDIDQLFGDAFVVKLNPSGTAWVMSTLLGGTGDDAGNGIAIDGSGNVFVAGWTTSTQFPVSTDANQKAFGGMGGQAPYQNFGDAFLVELASDFSKLVYATYIAGALDDAAGAIAMDSQGGVFVVGNTISRNFPTTTNARQVNFGGLSVSGYMQGDVFVTKLSGFGAPATALPTLGGLANSASNAAGTVSPGMIFTAYGTGMGPKQLVNGTFNGGFLTTSASGARLLFDGVPAPIVYASEVQSAGIVPYSVANKQSVQVVAEFNGQQSAPLNVRVVEAVPGLFSANFSGTGQGAIYNQDSTPNSAANPAAQESIIVLYGTGEGQTTPAGVDGKVAATDYPKPTGIVTANIGGSPAQVLYYGAVPLQVAGLFQINVKLPPGIGSGNLPVLITVGFARSQANLTVAVK